MFAVKIFLLWSLFSVVHCLNQRIPDYIGIVGLIFVGGLLLPIIFLTFVECKNFIYAYLSPQILIHNYFAVAKLFTKLIGCRVEVTWLKKIRKFLSQLTILKKFRVWNKKKKEKCIVCDKVGNISNLMNAEDIPRQICVKIIDKCSKINVIKIKDKICMLCVLKYSQKSDSVKEHFPSCGFCEKSLLCQASAEDLTIVAHDSFDNVQEFIKHRHFKWKEVELDGEKNDFLKYCFSLKHRTTGRSPRVDCCICNECFSLLLDRFSDRSKCNLTHAKDSEAKVLWSKTYNNENKYEDEEDMKYSNEQHVLRKRENYLLGAGDSSNGSDFSKHVCVLCKQDNKRQKSDLITPKRERKEGFQELLSKTDCNLVLPTDFATDQYKVHARCIRKKEIELKRKTEPSAPNISPTLSKKSKLDGENEDDYPILYDELEDENKNLSKNDILPILDSYTVQYIFEELEKKILITRKMIADFWNNKRKVLCILHDLDYSPDSKVTTVMDRIDKKWLETYPGNPLKPKFISNKNGYMIHRASDDPNKFSSVKDIEKRDNDFLETLMINLWDKLDYVVELNDNIYKDSSLLIDLNLPNMLKKIDNSLFNFMTIVTLTKKERKQCLRKKGLLKALMGESNLHETLNEHQTDSSYSLLVKRAVLTVQMMTLSSHDQYLRHPLNFHKADLLNKFSGSKQLFKIFNKLGITCSQPSYERQRKAIMETRAEKEIQSILPSGFNRGLYFQVSVDNFDAYQKGAYDSGTHVLGGLITTPNEKFVLPSSMSQSLSMAKETLDKSAILQSEIEENQLQRLNAKSLALVCFKEWNKNDKIPLQNMIKDLSPFPDVASKAYHMKLINQPPNSINTIREFLLNLKAQFEQETNVTKVVVVADGLIYNFLVALMEETDLKSFVLPSLGKET